MPPLPTQSIPESAKLLIKIDNTRPLPAAELGRLLTEVARDYKRAFGRNLVVLGVEQGSIWTWLTDEGVPLLKTAGEAAKAGKNIGEFAGMVWGWVKWGTKKNTDLNAPKPSRQDAGRRTAEAIFRAAVKSGGKVEFKHTSPDGHVVDVVVTPAEAVLGQARMEMQAAQDKRLKQTEVAKLPSMDLDYILEHIPAADNSGEEVSEETGQFIRLMVEVLTDAGQGHLVDELAGRLEASGRIGAARVVREAVLRRPPRGLLK